MNNPEPNRNDIPEMPTVEMPVVEMPTAAAPQDAPAEEIPTEKIPVEETPAETAPAEEAPKEQSESAYGVPGGNPYASGASARPGPEPAYSYTPYNRPLYEVAAPGVNGFAIASLVTGILSVICCCLYGFSLIPAALAVVFAILSRKASGGHFSGMAIAGLVTGIIGLALGAYVLYSVVLVFNMTEEELAALLEESGIILGEDGSITFAAALRSLFF